MADIYPFRAVHYNPKLVPDLSKAVTQPYDKITREMQANYYDLSPYNLVRIILGRHKPEDTGEDNVYTRAACTFQDWLREGILTSEAEPGLYPYFEEYTVPGPSRARKRRQGFIALCRLEDYSAGVVHRHEETLAAPKADRLELLKATRAHFGQIFMLYSDPKGSIEKKLAACSEGKPWERAQDEYGTLHTVWRVTDPAAIEDVVLAMRDKKLVIADGHHRYETALAYRNYCRGQSLPDDRPEYVMVTFVRMESEGLTILPTHRVVHSLPRFDWSDFLTQARKFFDSEEVHADGGVEKWGQSFLDRMAQAGSDGPTLGAYAKGGKLALLRLRSDVELERAMAGVPSGLRRLDVVLLHRLLLEGVLGIDQKAVQEERNLRYAREFEVAVGLPERGEAQVSFLMNATPVTAVWENALAGRVLPQKSTDFYPKLLTGLTIYWLDNPEGM